MATERLEATALKDKELGGFQGIVRFYIDDTRVWTDCTGITRTNKKDAMKDALVLNGRYVEELAESNS